MLKPTKLLSYSHTAFYTMDILVDTKNDHSQKPESSRIDPPDCSGIGPADR